MRGEIHRGSTANPAAGAVPGRGSAHDASIRMTVARFLEEGDHEVCQGSARDSAGRAAPSKRGNPARAPARVILALLLDAVGQFLGREDAPRYIAIGLLALVFVSMPWDVLAVHGADAFRWYLYTATPPGQERRFSSDLVGEARSNWYTMRRCLQNKRTSRGFLAFPAHSAACPAARFGSRLPIPERRRRIPARESPR